jgi:hypothetical protein
MNAPASITITPVRVADLLAEGERMLFRNHVRAFLTRVSVTCVTPLAEEVVSTW